MASSSSAPQKRTSVSPELPTHLPPTPMFKNNLIQFALKSNMKHPEFVSRNEGSSNAPAYRSSVMVDGLVFTSQLTFFHRKAADQEVARIALEYLTKKVKDEAYSIMSEAVPFCKSVLNEYASKLNIQLPTYKSVEYKEVIPYFVCTLVLNGTSYTGDAARRKKDAVELAARVAILSILGSSNSGVLLAQIIKAKAKLFGSTKPKTLQPTCDSVLVLPVEYSERSSWLLQLFGAKDKDKDKDVADPVDNDSTLQPTRDSVIVSPMGNSAHSGGHIQLLDDKDKNTDVADPVGNDNTLQPTQDSAIVSPMGNSAHSGRHLQLPDDKDKDKDVADPVGNDNTLQPTRDSVIVSPMGNSAHSGGYLQLLDDKGKDKGVADPVGNDNTLQPTRDSVIVSPMENSAHSGGHLQLLGAKDKAVTDPVGNDNINEIEMTCPESGPIISTSQQPEMQTHEPKPEVAKSSNEPEQPSAALPIDNGVSVKRRRRLKYKANKKARMEAELKALNESSCVAQ